MTVSIHSASPLVVFVCLGRRVRGNHAAAMQEFHEALDRADPRPTILDGASVKKNYAERLSRAIALPSPMDCARKLEVNYSTQQQGLPSPSRGPGAARAPSEGSERIRWMDDEVELQTDVLVDKLVERGRRIVETQDRRTESIRERLDLASGLSVSRSGGTRIDGLLAPAPR